MFSNIKRIIASVAAVQAAFLAYRLLAVPLIEPSVAVSAFAPIDPAASLCKCREIAATLRRVFSARLLGI